MRSLTPLERWREKRAEAMGIAGRHGASGLRIFGSAARGEATAASDLDLLVNLDPLRTLFDLVALERELTMLLGCPVQVVTERGLRPAYRERILSEAVEA